MNFSNVKEGNDSFRSEFIPDIDINHNKLDLSFEEERINENFSKNKSKNARNLNELNDYLTRLQKRDNFETNVKLQKYYSKSSSKSCKRTRSPRINSLSPYQLTTFDSKASPFTMENFMVKPSEVRQTRPYLIKPHLQLKSHIYGIQKYNHLTQTDSCKNAKIFRPQHHPIMIFMNERAAYSYSPAVYFPSQNNYKILPPIYSNFNPAYSVPYNMPTASQPHPFKFVERVKINNQPEIFYLNRAERVGFYPPNVNLNVFPQQDLDFSSQFGKIRFKQKEKQYKQLEEAINEPYCHLPIQQLQEQHLLEKELDKKSVLSNLLIWPKFILKGLK